MPTPSPRPQVLPHYLKKPLHEQVRARHRHAPGPPPWRKNHRRDVAKMGMDTIKTEGASGPVYSTIFEHAAGSGIVVLPAIPAGPQSKYRIVGVVVSVGDNSNVYLYHGVNKTAALTGNKAILAGIFTKAQPPTPYNLGDWACNQGASNEPVCVDSPNANIILTLQYQLLG